MIPTDKQKQWLWEQCGWEYDSEFDYWYPPGSPKVRGFYITYRSFEMDIDLNNLFKYAVPKVHDISLIKLNRFQSEWQTAYRAQARLAGKKAPNPIEDKGPAIALFWAIYKALGGKE